MVGRYILNLSKLLFISYNIIFHLSDPLSSRRFRSQPLVPGALAPPRPATRLEPRPPGQRLGRGVEGDPGQDATPRYTRLVQVWTAEGPTIVRIKLLRIMSSRWFIKPPVITHSRVNIRAPTNYINHNNLVGSDRRKKSPTVPLDKCVSYRSDAWLFLYIFKKRSVWRRLSIYKFLRSFRNYR